MDKDESIPTEAPAVSETAENRAVPTTLKTSLSGNSADCSGDDTLVSNVEEKNLSAEVGKLNAMYDRYILVFIIQ